MENGAFAPKEALKSKCSIFHNSFKYMTFQKRQKVLLLSKGLSSFKGVIWLKMIKMQNLCHLAWVSHFVHFLKL